MNKQEIEFQKALERTLVALNLFQGHIDILEEKQGQFLQAVHDEYEYLYDTMKEMFDNRLGANRND